MPCGWVERATKRKPIPTTFRRPWLRHPPHERRAPTEATGGQAASSRRGRGHPCTQVVRGSRDKPYGLGRGYVRGHRGGTCELGRGHHAAPAHGGPGRSTRDRRG